MISTNIRRMGLMSFVSMTFATVFLLICLSHPAHISAPAVYTINISSPNLPAKTKSSRSIFLPPENPSTLKRHCVNHVRASLLDPNTLVTLRPTLLRDSNPPIIASNDEGLSPKDRLEVFEKIWKEINEKFYDPSFKGIDWQAVLQRYHPLVEAVKTDQEFWELMSRMARELHDAHTRVL